MIIKYIVNYLFERAHDGRFVPTISDYSCGNTGYSVEKVWKTHSGRKRNCG
jgi:hypothetical protein